MRKTTSVFGYALFGVLVCGPAIADEAAQNLPQSLALAPVSVADRQPVNTVAHALPTTKTLTSDSVSDAAASVSGAGYSIAQFKTEPGL